MVTAADPTVLRIGTRGSALAMVQARMVQDALGEAGVEAALTTIVTEGDRRSPDTPWGEGAFVAAIERALLEGTIDVAVHSAKDVPTDEDPRLRIAAYLSRAAPQDVLVLPVGRSPDGLDALPRGARVGTDSPRRTAFLRAMRPDLQVHPLHGNVDTRLRRLDDGETDALVLAAAGLTRLGRSDRISSVLPTEVMPPAPGQGALALQVRASDAHTLGLITRLDDRPTHRAVAAERRLLAATGGGCRAPLGAFAEVRDGRLRLTAGVATADGAIAVRASAEATDEGDRVVIRRVLDTLAERAAAAAADIGARPGIVVTRATGSAAASILALVDRGLAPIHVPTIAVEPSRAIDGPALAERIAAQDWVVVVSAQAVTALVQAADDAGVDLTAVAGDRPRWAAVGPAVEQALRDAGIRTAFRPATATGAALAADIPLAPGDRVLVLRGDLGDARLPDALRERGASVESEVVYRTEEAPASSRAALTEALRRSPRAVLLTSGSTVRGWLALAEAVGAQAAARAIPAIAIGPSTAAEAERLGLRVLATSSAPEPGAVADTCADAIHRLLEST